MTLDDEEQRALYEIAARRYRGIFLYEESPGVIVYRCGKGHLHRAMVGLALVQLDDPIPVPNEAFETRQTAFPDGFASILEIEGVKTFLEER